MFHKSLENYLEFFSKIVWLLLLFFFHSYKDGTIETAKCSDLEERKAEDNIIKDERNFFRHDAIMKDTRYFFRLTKK